MEKVNISLCEEFTHIIEHCLMRAIMTKKIINQNINMHQNNVPEGMNNDKNIFLLSLIFHIYYTQSTLIHKVREMKSKLLFIKYF